MDDKTSLSAALDRAQLLHRNRTGVARALRVSRQKLWAWENGAVSMPDSKIIDLATMAGLDPVQLLGRYHLERHQGKATARVAASLAGVGLSAAALAGYAATGPVSEGLRIMCSLASAGCAYAAMRMSADLRIGSRG